MRSHRHIVLASLLVLSGAARAEHKAVPVPTTQSPPQPAPPPPGPNYTPPPPAGVSQDQAVQIASDFAAHQGLQVKRVKSVALKGDLWRVKLETHPKGKLTVEVDARSGQIVEAKEKLKHGHHGHD